MSYLDTTIENKQQTHNIMHCTDENSDSWLFMFVWIIIDDSYDRYYECDTKNNPSIHYSIAIAWDSIVYPCTFV